MKTTIEINSAKFEDVTFNIMPSGYGHWKLRASFFTPNNSIISHTITTNDSMLIDALRDEDDANAREQAADKVISAWIDRISENEFNHYINGAELQDEE